MRFEIFPLALFLCSVPVLGAERLIDFGVYPPGKTPAGFESVLTGSGTPGAWKIQLDDSPAPDATRSNSSTPGPKAVLAQLSKDPTDERFPLLYIGDDSFGDFTVTTRFKLVDGSVEQMAGLAFRVQDTNNYYYVRASGLGNTFRFVKLVNGQRLTTIGPSVPIARGVWHDLTVECNGNRIACKLDGKEVIPPLTDNTFTAGRLAFWTKSDSVVYFGPTSINFTPHERLAAILVREALGRYPRLAGLRIYAQRGQQSAPIVIASTHEDEVGLAGGEAEESVIKKDATFFGKTGNLAIVTMPLHDRNGEVAGAVRVVLHSFLGQTEQNAVARAQPVVREMEKRIRTAKELSQ